MTDIAALLESTGNIIMLFATPETIERERERAHKLLDVEFDLLIPRKFALAKALLTDGRDELAKAAADDLVGKADATELADARAAIRDIEARVGLVTPALAAAEEVRAKIKALQDFTTRYAALNALERRSDLRFAHAPRPVPPRQGHH